MKYDKSTALLEPRESNLKLQAFFPSKKIIILKFDGVKGE